MEYNVYQSINQSINLSICLPDMIDVLIYYQTCQTLIFINIIWYHKYLQ